MKRFNIKKLEMLPPPYQNPELFLISVIDNLDPFCLFRYGGHRGPLVLHLTDAIKLARN